MKTRVSLSIVRMVLDLTRGKAGPLDVESVRKLLSSRDKERTSEASIAEAFDQLAAIGHGRIDVDGNYLPLDERTDLMVQALITEAKKWDAATPGDIEHALLTGCLHNQKRRGRIELCLAGGLRNGTLALTPPAIAVGNRLLNPVDRMLIVGVLLAGSKAEFAVGREIENGEFALVDKGWS